MCWSSARFEALPDEVKLVLQGTLSIGQVEECNYTNCARSLDQDTQLIVKFAQKQTRR